MSREHHSKRFVLCVLLPIAIATFLAACLVAANAQTVKPQNAKTESPGNSDLGARIVSEGTSRGAIACARCHGYDGASDGSGAFPALVGQPSLYLSSQLQQYASGKRQNAIMQSIAKGLTPEETESVAEYYATVRASVVPRRPNSPQQVALGKQLALQGDSEARVQACVSCHGPDGAGLPPSIPYLAGQYQHYIKVQIQMFRMGYRTSMPMQDVAHAMPDQHLDAIAAYFDQLPLPSHK
jgi:cytochrome c553